MGCALHARLCRRQELNLVDPELVAHPPKGLHGITAPENRGCQQVGLLRCVAVSQDLWSLCRRRYLKQCSGASAERASIDSANAFAWIDCLNNSAVKALSHI